MSKKIIAIIIVQSVIIVLMALIIAILNTPEPEYQNTPYGITNYEYLGVRDYRELEAYKEKTKGYYAEAGSLWKNSQKLLEALYNKEENIPSEIKIDDKYCQGLDVRNKQEYKDSVSAEDLITCNVSVIYVTIYKDKAIVAYVYDFNLSDKNGKLKYRDFAHYTGPYKLCLKKDNESSQWYVDRLLRPA